MRQVESLAKQYQEAADKGQETDVVSPKRLNNNDYRILQKHLSTAFSTEVKFACDVNGKGKITFPFKNEVELERLISIFDKLKSEDSPKS
mgnify:FL=1